MVGTEGYYRPSGGGRAQSGGADGLRMGARQRVGYTLRRSLGGRVADGSIKGGVCTQETRRTAWEKLFPGRGGEGGSGAPAVKLTITERRSSDASCEHRGGRRGASC